MNALIMLLFNTKFNTWHPIFYYEKPFPGPYDPSNTLIRYKSKGHHTAGFKDIDKAIDHIENDLAGRIKGMGYVVHIELNEETWDGEDIPADTQLRSA